MQLTHEVGEGHWPPAGQREEGMAMTREDIYKGIASDTGKHKALSGKLFQCLFLNKTDVRVEVCATRLVW